MSQRGGSNLRHITGRREDFTPQRAMPAGFQMGRHQPRRDTGYSPIQRRAWFADEHRTPSDRLGGASRDRGRNPWLWMDSDDEDEYQSFTNRSGSGLDRFGRGQYPGTLQLDDPCLMVRPEYDPWEESETLEQEDLSSSIIQV